jgi:hypothetical protein
MPDNPCIPDRPIRVSVSQQGPHADPRTVRPLHYRPHAPIRSILDDPGFLIAYQGILDKHIPDVGDDLLEPVHDYNAVSAPLPHVPPVWG